MSHYFDSDGHLTDYALDDLINGCPDELSRLEIAEHLSFCDSCTERYACLLDGEFLALPTEPLPPAIIKRQRGRLLLFNRYVRAGVAACLAIAVWLGGSRFTGEPAQTISFSSGLPSLSQSFSEKITSLSQQFSENVNQIFNQFDLKEAFQHEEKK